MSYTARNPNGQATMANSQPVVIASDQTVVATSAKQDDIITAIGNIPGGGGVQYTEGDTDATITGTVMMGEGSANALQPVALDASNNMKVAVQGTVPVSGTFYQATQPVSLASVPSHDVTNAGTFAVQVTSAPTTTVQATQLDVDNLNATDDVVTVTGGAGQTADVKVTLDGESVPVTGTFWQATQPVSGTVTANAGSGTMAVSMATQTPTLATRTSGGATTYHLVSAATTNATNIKASAGQLYGWYIYNSNASARKVAFHNTSGTPTAGASVYFSLVIPASSGANVFSDIGIPFSTGIAITTTTGLADSDSAAVAANDLVINLWYS